MASLATMRQRVRRRLMQWGWRVMMSIGEMRREYDSPALTESAVDSDPFAQFRAWFADAEAADILDPNAMTLATCSAAGEPAARIVLLKELDDLGFVFYTNYRSAKANDLADNPCASLLFYWDKLNRTVRVTGDVTRVDRATSEQYFATRPRASQIAAWASHQSELLDSRDALDASFAEYERRFEGKDVETPPFWGGYRVVPRRFEFWQGQPSRMHDRLCYERDADGAWRMTRLAP